MSVTVEWTVEIGGQSTVDHTDRVTGFRLEQIAPVQQGAKQSAIITITNHDGAYTPGAGGTYTSTDWFAQGVFISASVNGGSAVQVFHGVVDDFQLDDDGTTSTVTLIAIDGLTALGRAQPHSFVIGRNPFHVSVQYAFSVMDGIISGERLPLPTFGAPYAADNFDVYADSRSTTETALNITGDEFFSDLLNTRLLPTDLSTVFATRIEPFASAALYSFRMISNLLTRDTGYHMFAFDGDSPAAGELPIQMVERAFTIDRLVNQVSMTSGTTGTTEQVYTDTTSRDQYGLRRMTFTGTTQQNDAVALECAQNIVERQKDSSFTARTLTFNFGQLSTLPAGTASEVELFLDVDDFFWNPATIAYTPTGAGSQTVEECVMIGRRMFVTPGDTTVIVDLLPAADFQSFRLDDTGLGVLDQNRLG